MRRRTLAHYAALAALAAVLMLWTIGESYIFRHEICCNYVLEMLDGTMRRPYVYRTLIPQWANAIVLATPASMQDGIAQMLMQIRGWRFVEEAMAALRWPPFAPAFSTPYHLYQAFVVAMLLYASLCVYGWGLYRLSEASFPHHGRLPFITALIGLLAIVPLIDYHTKLYDFPVLALMTLGLLAMQRRNWPMYLIVFTLACINRETAIFLTMVFALTQWKAMPMRRFAALCLVQLILYAGILYLIQSILTAQPANHFHFTGMRVLWREIRHFGMLYVVIPLMFAALMWTCRRHMPDVLRWSLVWVPLCVGAYLFFGKFREYRVFLEAFPPLAVMGAYGVAQWFNLRQGRNACTTR